MKTLQHLLLATVAGISFWASPSITRADALDLWLARNSGAANILNADAFGNGIYVAVGNEGTILTSTNGLTWTRRTSGTTHSPWRCCAIRSFAPANISSSAGPALAAVEKLGCVKNKAVALPAWRRKLRRFISWPSLVQCCRLTLQVLVCPPPAFRSIAGFMLMGWFATRDLPAASAIRVASKPSRPDTGGGRSNATESTNACISAR